MLYPSAPEAATRFLHFVNASPTPFHAVVNASLRLEKAGFKKVLEKENWEDNLQAGGKYYFTRNQSSLLAFTLPQKWKPGAGVSIVATHIDSPNLKIRPVSKRSASGYLQVGVETYGGGIWHSWFDRDLSIAGRVVVAGPASGFTSKLVKIDRPLLRIPTLAIHLERGAADNFKFNTESEFIPILGQVASELNATPKPDVAKTNDSREESSASSIQANHHSVLLALLAAELQVEPDAIHDFELSLFDTQPSVLGGLNNEFIFSPRMDNLVSSFCAVEALTEVSSSSLFPKLEGNVNLIALFNHEEIGSVSSTGAESSLVPSLIERLSPTPALLGQSISKSFLISADMGHAVHPNYPSKHEDNHKPRMNAGIVIKTNAKQRYASDAIGSFVVKKLVEKRQGKVQEFEVRNDMACGSTVGPFLSKLGLRTVDVGNAMLSMHSIRETAGSHDVQHAIDLFSAFFEGFADLDANLTLE
ncbi:peptidase M18, aminopeptidase I [Auriscalpium vulgare]|uniref:Peptidase M18, aminopeptidase I n=1 Tax=Auriscalpium vulgare TaxID=40419 RepID=A0ACB8S186_9AGAM|nr:peptidase M18, aminopeptidase I [Auriscalpium vulgare]